jgi:hypothetical protein
MLEFSFMFGCSAGVFLGDFFDVSYKYSFRLAFGSDVEVLLLGSLVVDKC